MRIRARVLAASSCLVLSTLMTSSAGAAGFPPCGPFPPRHAFAAAIGLDGKQIWSTPLPIAQDGDGVTLPPLVDGATTYLAAESSISALDSADGHVLWQARQGTLLYNLWRYGNVLAVLSDQVGKHATVTGYDAATGAVLWRYLDPGFGMYNVVVQTSGGAAAWIREDGVVQALDLTNGKLRWSHRVAKNQPHLQVPGASVTATDGVVLFEGDGAVTAYDERTGKRRWVRAQLPEQPNVAVADGVVALTPAVGTGKPGQAVGMSVVNGKVLWQRRFPATSQVGVEATDAGFLLTGGVNRGFREYMLAPRTGKTRWSAPAQLHPLRTAVGAIVGKDLLRLTSTWDLYPKYTLSDRDLRTGRVRWKVALHGAPARATTVAASPMQVYLIGPTGSRTTKGAIRAYSRSNGHALWSLTAPTSLWFAPVLGAGHLTLAEVDGGNECPA